MRAEKRVMENPAPKTTPSYAEPDLFSDATFLVAFRAGERAALTVVYDSYVGVVTAVVEKGMVLTSAGDRVRIGLGVDALQVETLVHDAFIRLFSPRARERYDPLRPFGAWAATVTRNLLIDSYRKERRRGRTVPLTDANLKDMSVEPDAPIRIEHEEIARILDDFQISLKPKQLKIFRHRYIEGLTLKETAAFLSMNLMSVRRVDVRLRRLLLKRLRWRGYLKNAEIRLPTTDRPGASGRKD